MESTNNAISSSSDEIQEHAISRDDKKMEASSVTTPKDAAASSVIDDPELDALLNDALQDFGKVPQIPQPKRLNPSGGTVQGGSDDMNQVWTEEFIKEATAQFEKKMRECMLAQQEQAASGCATQSLGAMNQVVEAARQAATGNLAEPSAVMSQINEAMKNFNLPSASNDGTFGDEELSKLMSTFGMGEGGPIDVAEDGELDEFLPFMTNFMEKILSKDLLYPVLTDIVDRYPEWLADQRPKLSAEDFDKYNRQYGFMKMICEEYAAETPSDNEETKRKRFDRISELMIKVQCCGTPPKDLIGEDGTFPSMDPAAAFASLGVPGVNGEQCSIV